MPINVLLADDHPAIRLGLQELLASTQDIRVVATCADGDEVVAAAARSAPDVVLMDLNMPTVSGLTAARELLAAQPQVRIVFLSGNVAARSADAAMAVGVAGFLLKEDDPFDLPERIRAVAAGGTTWSTAAAAMLTAPAA
jgi:DNA-binding NarL/FixJ family response regulator